MQAALKLAIASQLDKHRLVEAQAHKIERLVDGRTSTRFLDVSHSSGVGIEGFVRRVTDGGEEGGWAGKERRAGRGAGQQR